MATRIKKTNIMAEFCLFKFVLLSRLFLFSLQVLFNASVPDHNADAFRLPAVEKEGMIDKVVFFLFGGLSKWDAQYYLHIALFGYTYENTLAFFPAFPLLMRLLSDVIEMFTSFFLNPLSCMLLSGAIINSLCFSFSALYLYKLTEMIFKSSAVAHIAVVMYCFNPASIFFSVLYSESLFVFLTFAGLWAIESDKKNVSLVALSLSSLTRSNGIMSFGFFLHHQIKQFISYQNVRSINFFSSTSSLKISLGFVTKTIFQVFIFLLPFVYFQFFSFLLYCTNTFSNQALSNIIVEHAFENKLKLPGEFSEWCNWKIPLSYSFIQSHYWNVGFLRYYTLKQVPNFILAFPILILAIGSSFAFFRYNWNQFKHLGLVIQPFVKSNAIWHNILCLPYFIHIFVLAMFSTFCIHVQVSTRLLCSSSPILYWVVAFLLLPKDSAKLEKLEKRLKTTRSFTDEIRLVIELFQATHTLGKSVCIYFLSYFVIGTLLHVNFFPWT